MGSQRVGHDWSIALHFFKISQHGNVVQSKPWSLILTLPWVWSLGWEDPPGEEKGYPLQYSGLENSMDCIVYGVTKSRTWLRDVHFSLFWLYPLAAVGLMAGEVTSQPNFSSLKHAEQLLHWEWSEVAQSCLTFCDAMECRLPGSSVHGIFQARILEWVAFLFSRGIFPTQGSNPG